MAMAEETVRMFRRQEPVDRPDAAQGCEGCGRLVWPGMERRSDARHCSAACRAKTYRRRRKAAADHDDEA
ncbi:hypothetical protein [Streptodolium elevatio]|uniref:Uncharacterized protein n=1 Tax=Streptodolium elevatio TaxID=3157996 RepID=A0ABV3DW50_9ACTN